jgi:hypothetical protein
MSVSSLIDKLIEFGDDSSRDAGDIPFTLGVKEKDQAADPAVGIVN